MKIETDVTPPDVEEDEGGDERSARIGIHFLDLDEVSYDAAVQFFGEDALDVDKFAEAVLNVALALASMRGSDYSWALRERLVAYDGMGR